MPNCFVKVKQHFINFVAEFLGGIYSSSAAMFEKMKDDNESERRELLQQS